jgi:hypothetical protein
VAGKYVAGLGTALFLFVGSTAISFLLIGRHFGAAYTDYILHGPGLSQLGVDGVSTPMLPIYINTPFQNSYAGPIPRAGGCPANGYPASAVGNLEDVTNRIIDLTGNTTLTKIDVNETLENQKLLQTPSNWPLPAASVWKAQSDWNTNTTFLDTFWVCGPPTGDTPQQVNYNLSASTGGMNETQKLWVGSQTHYSGECVEIDMIQLNTGYATQTLQTTPGSTPDQQAACAVGQSIYNK